MRLSAEKTGLAGGTGFDPQCLKRGWREMERGRRGKDSRGKVV